MDCLNNIIGISESTCECLADGRPTDYNVSASGLYLDRLDYFNPEVVKSGDDCARGGYWDRCAQAIEDAKTAYKSDLMRCIGAQYKPRINALDVQLGSAGFKQTQNLSKAYAGMRIMPYQIKSGYILIKKIGVIVNQSVPVTVKIFSNVDNGTLIYESSPINATGNVLTWAAPAQPIELPMWSYQTNVSYYVVLEMNGTFQPKDNKKDCGCGGVQRPYLSYLDFEGVVGDDTTNVNGWSNTTSINGIVVDVQVKCKASDLICSDERPLDFSDDGDAIGMAAAIRFWAAAKLYEEVLSSTNIDRITLLNREEMVNYVKYWQGEYMNWVTYICSNFSIESGITGCYLCKDVQTTLQKNNIGATYSRHNYHKGLYTEKNSPFYPTPNNTNNTGWLH